MYRVHLSNTDIYTACQLDLRLRWKTEQKNLNKQHIRTNGNCETYAYMFCAVSTGKVQNCTKKQHCERKPPNTKLFQKQPFATEYKSRDSTQSANCAQFDPKRVSAYNRPRSISVYEVRPLVGLNIHPALGRSPKASQICGFSHGLQVTWTSHGLLLTWNSGHFLTNIVSV